MAFKEEDELMYRLFSLCIYCELLLPNSSIVEGVGGVGFYCFNLVLKFIL